MRKLLFVMTLLLPMVLLGCGSTGGVSQADYDAVVNERDATIAELNKLKEEGVAKEEYDKVLEEKSKLEEELASLKKIATEATTEAAPAVEQEQKSEESPVEVKFKTPISFIDEYMHAFKIEEFNITELEVALSGDVYQLKYECKGIAEDDEYFSIYCYDKDGTVLDSFSVAFTDIGVKCRTSDFTYIPIDTAYLNIKKM